MAIFNPNIGTIQWIIIIRSLKITKFITFVSEQNHEAPGLQYE